MFRPERDDAALAAGVLVGLVHSLGIEKARATTGQRYFDCSRSYLLKGNPGSNRLT
jgi:hypothetical protein